MKRIAEDREVEDSDLWSIGGGPAPAVATILAQNGWLDGG